MARRKGHDRRRRFEWSAADQTDNNIAYMAALVVTLESASRFKGADESSAQATISTTVVNMVACAEFSSAPLNLDADSKVLTRVAI